MKVLSEEQKGPILSAWRRTCAHVSGGAMGTTVAVLERHGALADLLAARSPVLIDALAVGTGLQPAYAQLAALILATQGLATLAGAGTSGATVRLTDDGRAWARHAAAYDRFEDVLDLAGTLRAALAGGPIPAERFPLGASTRARDAVGTAPSDLAERLRLHLRGPLIAVAVHELGRARAFGRIARAPLGWCPLDALALPRPALDACVALLAEEGWLVRDDDLVRMTPEGLAGVRWMALHGYLVGYLGVLGQVGALLGLETPAEHDATAIKSNDDRTLLLAGKAQVFARGGLRGPFEDMVRALFDAEPLASQPCLLLDMSAGDGSVLATLHELIATQTRRGAALREYPLTLVGLAGNAVARERAADRLARAGVPCLLLQATIEDPDRIASDLARAGLDLRDALVVSKTCIHGRGYRGTHGATLRAADDRARDGVYVSPEGELIAPAALEDDLAAFFARWAAWLPRHGMIAADAHTVPAGVAAAS